MEEEKSQKTPPKFEDFRAEFNAAQDYLKEVVRVIAEINRIAVYAKSGYKEYNKFYFALVHQLYITISGVLGDYEITKYNTEFDSLVKDFDTKKPTEIPFLIDKLHQKLMTKIQRTGFLVPVSIHRKGAIHFRKPSYSQNVEAEHSKGDE